MTKRVRYSITEPYSLFLVFVAIGLGTIPLDQPARLALLWSTLVVLSVLYRGHRDIELDFSLAGVGRGALLGLVISVPLLAFLADQLRVFTERLYASNDVVSLLYQICFISAPVEEYFFRGVVQSARGSSVGVTLYALTALLYFLPVPRVPFLVVCIVFVAMGVLGIVYGYVRDRYGLAASIACHVAVGLVLQVLPTLIVTVRVMLS